MNCRLIIQMETPLVSIVCDVYNHEPYLRKCLDGFVMQETTFPFEILIHDDASSDHSSDIIHEYEKRYPALFKPIYQKVNQYSKGVKIWATIQFPRAKGKFIAICEGDDYWTDPLKLQKQVDFLEKNKDIGLCFTDYSIRNASLKLVKDACFRNGKPRSTCFEDHLLSQGYIAPMTWMYRKDVYLGLDTPTGFIDGTFAVALEFFKKSQVGFIDDDTAVHVIHPGSATNQIDLSRRVNYLYDVVKEQLFFSRKYCDDNMTSRICFNKYLELLPMAVLVNNESFLADASAFFTGKGACFDDLLRQAEEISQIRQDAINARSSYSYRLGALILRPFKLFLKKS